MMVLHDVRHVVSRRSVVVGLVGLTAAGLVTALGTEKLWYRLLQPHAGASPQKPKLEPTATPS